MYWVDRFYIKKPRIRKLISRLLFKDQETSVNLFNTDLIINEIKENGYYRASKMCDKSSLLHDEVSALINISMLLENEDSFVDIGANIGIFSSILSRYKNILTNFNIYAFEANPDTYTRLKNNADYHEFIAHNIAISNQESELDFLSGAVSHVFTTVENASDYHIKNQVTHVLCKPLNQFEFSGDSIILKIDVEGQELQVLEGAASFFESKRIKAVYVDGFSDWGVIDFLQKYHFSLYEGRYLLETDGDVFSLLAVSQEKFIKRDL